ncbi:unnamed protein product [Hermetia illucens]|uniref:Uncharacterized protein n=1 Tax=Hermetia illucens TaxID=343691 RepID=A0A7R8UM96_HERIL|nr:unnamed protein product [Hermetia illucens]
MAEKRKLEQDETFSEDEIENEEPMTAADALRMLQQKDPDRLNESLRRTVLVSEAITYTYKLACQEFKESKERENSGPLAKKLKVDDDSSEVSDQDDVLWEDNESLKVEVLEEYNLVWEDNEIVADDPRTDFEVLWEELSPYLDKIE